MPEHREEFNLSSSLGGVGLSPKSYIRRRRTHRVWTVLTLVTALTVLTADIVDGGDLIGWMTSLAICSSAFAVNNVNLVNPVRCQHSQPCQHCQCRQRVAAARRLRSPALQDTLEKGVRATLPIDVRLRLVSAIWDTLPQDADLSPSVLQQA